MSPSRTGQEARSIETTRAPRLFSAPPMRAIQRYDSAVTMPRGHERIVIAEDDACLRRVTRRLLRGLGYEVDDFPHGIAALDEVERERTPVELLLTDYDMPGINGYELAQRMRLSCPGLRVLLSSAWPEERIAPAGNPPDWPPYLAKPYTPERLAQKVREILDTRSAL